MKISNNINQHTPSHKGALNNKFILKGLETISEHGSTFVAATTLAMSAGVRPIAISLTPNTQKENKQYAITNSIASGLVKFAMVEALAIPVENAIKQIDKTPEKFLTPQAINTLKGKSKTLSESQNYKFITQILKMSTGLITAIPKAVLTVAFIPILMDLLFKNKKKKENSLITIQYNKNSKIFDEIEKKNQTPSFKGKIANITAGGIGKFLNNNIVHEYAKTYSYKHSDIARNMSIATDLLLTASFVHRTSKNKDIKESKKKPLIYNNLISTGITLTCGYGLDSLIKKSTNKFIEKFSEANKDNPKLPKYIEGINILRPTLIFAGIYYGILPIISTYISDKITSKEN